MRDGKDILVEKESSGILPNADSTYYMQSSLEISLQEEDRHRYACRVEHSSLAEPALVWVPWEEGPPAPLGPGLHHPGCAGSGWSHRSQRYPVEEKISRPMET
ncbi:unnamed protein product [Lepidochelys kempii]